MLKRIVILSMLSLLCFGYVHSQQITRFAVVDLPRVYTAFFRDSRAVREYEERSAKLQSDIDRYSREIQDLIARHAEAVLQDNQTEVLRLDSQIRRRTEFLKEFHETRTAALENERNRLMQSSSFLNQVYDEIQYIAESEGYSMVINLKDNPSIIWYSRTVDITDRLIRSLQTRTRN